MKYLVIIIGMVCATILFEKYLLAKYKPELPKSPYIECTTTQIPGMTEEDLKFQREWAEECVRGVNKLMQCDATTTINNTLISNCKSTY